MAAAVLSCLKYIIFTNITFSSNVNRFVTKWKQENPDNVVTLELLTVMPSLVLEELVTKLAFIQVFSQNPEQ